MLQSFGQQKAKHFSILNYFEQKCISDSVLPTAASASTYLLDLRY